MRKLTVPSPWPSTAEVKLIQLTGEVARQPHSRATAIARLPDPPVELNCDEGDETVASHRDEAGVVTFVDVDAELPQPNAASDATAATNS